MAFGDDEETFFHSCLNVVGDCEDWDSEVERSIDLIKHQFLPLIGNTNNLALIFDPSVF